MCRHRVVSAFPERPSFSFQSLFTRILISGIGLGACLIGSASFAQRGNLPQAAEQSKIIQLRQEWFYQQRAYPHKHIPPGARFRAFQQLRKMQAVQRAASQQLKQQTTTSTARATSGTVEAKALSSTSWTLIGPQPTATNSPLGSVSGRVTALAVDPTNPQVVYLGGAEGGVWKSTDGGTTWTPLTDNQPSLAVGSIAIDPENPQTIYVGTGEEDFALYNYAGAGILKSTDGGSTWTQLAGPFVGPFGSQSPYCGGAYIGSIAVDPGNSQVILAGATFSCSLGSGAYRSTDGGTSWTLVLGTAQAPAVVKDIVFDPTNGNNVYAAAGNPTGASNNGIWKSTNAGLTWALDDGSGTTVFPGSSAGNISLAMAPSSPTTLYAGVASASSGSASLLGVYKTTNGGAAWTQLTSAPQYCSPQGGSLQCYFDNVVAVSPTNPNIVLLGGSEAPFTTNYTGTLYLSLDGGTTWTDITTDSGGNAIHPDMHSIAFSADGSKMYVGNDGGLWSTSLSSTGVGTWTDLNQPLALTQFYPGMSIDPTNPNNAFAGSQDNGIQEYSGNLIWGFVGCGDGGQTAFDYVDLNTLYVGCDYVPPNPYPFLYKLTANPPTAVAADNGINGSDNGSFIPPLTMDPSNPDTLYFGTNRLYQTTDAAANWAPISYDLTSDSQGILSSISAIAVAPSDSNTVFVGTGDGRLWSTTIAGSGYCCNNITNGTPNRSVTAIAITPTSSQTAYATFSGYSGFNGDTLGHVFETTNGGTNWTDISSNLPNVPVNDIVVDPDVPNTLYVATDVGVFETTDGGATWAPFGAGLPDVAIMSLKLQRASRILRAASYGRSAWDIQLPVPVGPTAVLSSPALDFAPQQVGTTSAAQTVTLANNSSTVLAISSIAASANFAETNTCSTSLAAGASCTISVTFTPVALGAVTGDVTISDNAASGSSQTISLSGDGFSGAVSLSPSSLSFGNQLVGTTSATQTVTVTNSSSAPLTITSMGTPSDFTTTTDCPFSNAGALAGGASCHIYVSFAPTTMGALVEQVAINDSAGDSPQTIPVTGNGIQGVVTFTPNSLTFNPQQVGTTSASQTATLTNTGTTDLTINSLTPTASTDQQSLAIVNSSNDISETDTCPRSPSTLPPNGSCTITVSFSPTVWGSLSGSIEVTDNGRFSPQYLDVSGTAYSGTAQLSASSLTFTNVAVGQTSQPQTVTLTNSGSSPLYVASISGVAPFAESDNCPRPATSPSALAAGATCTISVTYTPDQVQTDQGRLFITDSSSGNFLQWVDVSGSGFTDFSLAVAPGTPSQDNVIAGQTATYSLVVTPAPGFTQTVSLGCSGAPAGGACTVSPSVVALDGTNPQNVKVSVTTTARSLVPPGPNGGPPPPGGFAIACWWIALLLMAALAVAFKRRRRIPLLAGAVLLAAIALSCGGGGGGGGGSSSSQGTPVGISTLTVAGTSGTLIRQTTLTLSVN